MFLTLLTLCTLYCPSLSYKTPSARLQVLCLVSYSHFFKPPTSPISEYHDLQFIVRKMEVWETDYLAHGHTAKKEQSGFELRSFSFFWNPRLPHYIKLTFIITSHRMQILSICIIVKAETPFSVHVLLAILKCKPDYRRQELFIEFISVFSILPGIYVIDCF
jgi:hypothetical protein